MEKISNLKEKIICCYPPFIWNRNDNKQIAVFNSYEKGILHFEIDIETEDIFNYVFSFYENKTYNENISKDISTNEKEWDVLSSKGDKSYKVMYQNGNFNCSCPSYSFIKNCKHIDKIKKENNL